MCGRRRGRRRRRTFRGRRRRWRGRCGRHGLARRRLGRGRRRGRRSRRRGNGCRAFARSDDGRTATAGRRPRPHEDSRPQRRLRGAVILCTGALNDPGVRTWRPIAAAADRRQLGRQLGRSAGRSFTGARTISAGATAREADVAREPVTRICAREHRERRHADRQPRDDHERKREDDREQSGATQGPRRRRQTFRPVDVRMPHLCSVSARQ